MTHGAGLKMTLVDMTAFFAQRIRNVKCKIITPFGCGNTQKLAILRL